MRCPADAKNLSPHTISPIIHETEWYTQYYCEECGWEYRISYLKPKKIEPPQTIVYRKKNVAKR